VASSLELEKSDISEDACTRTMGFGMIPCMQASEVDHNRVWPSPMTASAVAAFSVNRFDGDGWRIALPRPEIQIVARFGPSARNNLDVHAMGTQQAAHRKHIRGGQWAVTAHLHLGASYALLGAPASAVAGSIVALEDLWGHQSVRSLLERLAGANDGVAAIEIIDRALAQRLAPSITRGAGISFVRRAASRLMSESVNSVAAELGVSERHLRRIFREFVGTSPKAFARLSRFRNALRIAREGGRQGWAHIASEAGYFDQSHLIEEFRAISGVTPRALLSELGIF
jgi:AraC-like DNA-binding protein